jgi:hypothetical protein
MVIGALFLLSAVLVPQFAFAQGPTTHRPISDFTSTQGTWCDPLPNVTNCPNFVTRYIGWSGQSTPAPTRLASVDFAAKEPVVGTGPNRLNTTTNGTITERALPDGRAEVHIVLQTRNALTQVWACDNLTCPAAVPIGAPWFGHSTAEVLNGQAPGVADSSIEVTFINSAPGAPIPDLVRYVQGDLPITDVKQISFQANATGPLRAGFGVLDGTPGRVHIIQAGLIGAALKNGFRGALSDAFPVERIDLRAIGK